MRTSGALALTLVIAACGPRRDQDHDPDKVERIHVGSGVKHVGSAAQPIFDPSNPGSGQGWGSGAADRAHELARGAYVVDASGCLVCHTAMGPGGPDVANAGAGGLEMPGTIGTWRSPNITPDKATGIGNWTDDQIARAIREGTRPDGTQLYSIMPYALYNRMTDRDIAAVVAFVRTLKPVARVVAANKNLKFPHFAVPMPPNAPDEHSDTLKHGEYLATLMLCAHCHQTPSKDGPPATDHMFSGGLDMTITALGTGKLYAPNITPDADTGIGKWTEQQIFTTLKTMIRPDSRLIAPPMLMLQSGWSKLTDADLHAVATYIHQVPAIKNQVPPSTFKLKR
jgi:mono/diheme cytochrome c family protein